MSANLVAIWYLVASVCFILALKGLSHPETARRGNYFGIAGMTIAVLTTLAIVAKGRLDLILLAMVIGGIIGAIGARRVQMTQMPELVAVLHSLVGLAAVLVGFANFLGHGVTLTGAELTVGAPLGGSMYVVFPDDAPPAAAVEEGLPRIAGLRLGRWGREERRWE